MKITSLFVLVATGAVSDVKVMVDEEKKSRGFGFISFEEYSSAKACLKQRFVDICGKQVRIFVSSSCSCLLGEGGWLAARPSII